MRFSRFKYLICVIVFTLSFCGVKAQAGLCPDNMDFEHGDFTNWECRWGTVSAPGGINTLSLLNVGLLPGRHTIISAATAGVDPYGGFPQICPNGSRYSVMLGSTQIAIPKAESVSYTYTIPAGVSAFSIFFWYAVVLFVPGHTAEQQPRFRARITNVTDNVQIPCVNFDFTASASLPGFNPSPLNSNVYYKDWTPITLNLSGLAGKTIKLEFITSNCTPGGHFGYAYLDVNTACNGAVSGTTICQGSNNNSITLTAPFGFQSYQWYADNTFSTVLSGSQTLPLNPAPSVGTVFPVVVTPYPGFGCKDTLFATISTSPRPVSNAGADANICQSQSVRIGTISNSAYSYEWTPAAQVSNPSISNPLAWNIPPNPGQFIVKTTDILTGCYSYDTTIVIATPVDTALTFTGKKDFCAGETIAAALSVNSNSASVQWYNGANAIPGATGTSYQPVTTGNYWAAITQTGCVDSTLKTAIAVHPIPLPSFTANRDTGCITNNSFQLTNTSTIPDNSVMNYLWKFSDGNTSQSTDATKTFSTTGMFNTELISITPFGCKDSTNRNIYVLPNGTPNFSWDSICLNRPVLFNNRSNENGSTLVNYNWTFNNGGTGSLLKDPLPVIYTTAGNFDATLKMTTLGCETDAQSITRAVFANKQASGIRYREITVPQGSSKFIHVRDSLVGNAYTWRPQQQLSSYSTRYTEFFASNNDMEYKIDVSDIHTCLTTDTIKMLILKKPGFYLPTAFTPNGDGLNDVAKPYLVGMKSLKNFSVFNRWGNLVFYSSTYAEGWDGKYKGTAQDAGVYVWVLEFIDSSDKKITEKGTITIIR